ncbi:ATP-dependent DNA helicase 2 subunit [Thraustotheca clavata]|uniref:ATP-dependent DNA helicase 2 subunit n=1 Tax=Thraustotheca clavata TaxID=74557 RepID=A0A1W0A5L5_9STRA|nr:ATP-dependent DNA helicase 2 subunit [Thraustotheca clavata]
MAFEWQKDVKEEEEEDWESAQSGKEVLLVLLDVRSSLFTPLEDGNTWFNTCVEMLVKLLKSKIIANDNSLMGIIFFGTSQTKNVNSLEHVYEFQELGFPSAHRIKQLRELMTVDFAKEYGSMASNDQVSLSNALWHAGIAFSNANLKKKDSQTIWILTNNEDPTIGNAEECERVLKQFTNHMELKRSIQLFYMPPPAKESFSLSSFYSRMFMEATMLAQDDLSTLQPAYAIHTYQEMMEESLRKRFRKRRLTTLSWTIAKGIAIGVELYALTVKQAKPSPINLEAETNSILKTETKWLCDETGMYLTPEQVKKYIEYGKQRVYFSSDDMVELKYFDAAGLQLLGFQPKSLLKDHENLRAPYFIYPAEGYIEGSTVAFVALLQSMVKKDVMAIARLIVRKNTPPRLVAIVPQEEIYDDQGQIQPSGFNLIFLPYVDDVRNLRADHNSQRDPTLDQVDAAKKVIQSLTIKEVPSFQNPELQKHYASIQALALNESSLAFDDKDDTTLPDVVGFKRNKVVSALESFRELCGGDELAKDNAKRKASTPGGKGDKKAAKHNADVSTDLATWKKLAASGVVAKKTVVELKAFLSAHGQSTSGKKDELVNRAMALLH